jgi:hypothetical protein
MARRHRRASSNVTAKSRNRRQRSDRPGVTQPRRLTLESLELRQLLSVNPIISEVLGDNEAGIVDSSGNHTDWLEICNPSSAQAIDLTGWKLQYGGSSTWTFPSMSLGPGESRVIFCTSGNSQTDPNQELHANFNLSKEGKYLALINSQGTVVQSFSPTYPALATDVSYGTGQAVTETKLVAAGATVRYYAPTDGSLGSTWTQAAFNDSAWASGTTGLGSVNLVSGFAVTNYKSSLSSISSVAQAQSVIDNASNQSWTMSETASVVNYQNTGGGGEFATGDNPFPGMAIGTDYDCFVTKATGQVHIPSAGNWTFGVNSDDGFSCTINGQTFAYDGLRGPSDSFATINFAAAGDYDVSLLFFENGGGSCLELFAASGTKTSFDSSFHLVGDTAAGGLSVQSVPFTGSASGSAFVSAIQTNVQSTMTAANNTSLYTRITFDAPDLASLQSLTLKMKYDDGYVAYLNGVEVARRNVPTSVTWNSHAVAERTSDTQTTTFENIDVSAFLNAATTGHLLATGNVLAIQVMKSSLSEGDLLLVPELSQIVVTSAGNHFFADPSPGTANTIDTWQPDISFSVEHGFFYQSFSLAITTTTTGADIYYTLDGSAPSATHGTHYTAPITISTTATVRAVSLVSGGFTGIVSTETYIFPNAVINQPSLPAGYPTSWGSEAADYAMDARITTDPTYSSQMVQSLLAVPTMSIVTDLSNLFDPVTGIYANATNSDLEVPVSLEYIDPATGQTFQINAALRMQGGVGRYAGYEKHSFRLVFKSPYGPTKLEFPLFGDDAADSFDTLTLRANFNDAWVWGGSDAQYIRDQFADQTLLAMGDSASHGTYVQLYINGLYWGLYNPTERPDTSFDATYMGGDKDDWDGLNADTAVNGSDVTEYNELVNFDFESGSTAAYQRVQGNNPDGTRNSSYPVLLDMNNYIDYMLLNFYIGNTDWPGHNWYMGREEDSSSTTLDSTGFKCFPWDSEMATGLQWSHDPNVNSIGGGWWAGWMATTFDALKINADFRMLFADRAQKFLFNGGALTVAAAQARYSALANTVQTAIIAESARWGDVSGTLYRPSDWLNSRDYVLSTWLSQRTSILIQQLKNASLYPTVAAPSYAVNGEVQYGGLFSPGDTLTITASASPIYYTLDGSDPRLAGGGLSPNAILYSGPITLTEGVEVKARVYSGGTWSALSDAGYYVNLAPAIRITEMMYHPLPATADEIARGYTGSDNNDFEYIEIKNIGTNALPLAGLRFDDGVTFTFPNITLAPNQYILVVANQAAFQIRYPSVSTSLIAGQYSGHLDSAGENVRLDAPNGGVVQEFIYDDAWYEQTDGEGFSLTVRDPLQTASLWQSGSGWRASALPNGSPGGDETNPIPTPGAIVINEVLAHPSTSGGDMIELHNTTSQAIDISGWFISDSSSNLTKYQIAANTTLAAGAYLVLTDEQNYGVGSGDSGVHTAFSLSERGGDLYLSSNAGGSAGGYREHVGIDYAPAGVSQGLYTKSTGETDFTLLETPTFGAAPSYSGGANSEPYVAPVVLSEIMYHPAEPTAAEQTLGFTNEDAFEFLELYNNSGSPQTLSDFYIADGIGFTFGWYPDGTSGEYTTLESGATATWSASGLQANAYSVYTHVTLVDGNGKRRDDLDQNAQYTITYAGGSITVTIDQNQLSVNADDVWVNLGAYMFDGPATVTLARGDTDPDNWTVADSIKFTAAGQSDVVVGSPSLDSFSTSSGITTIAPGGYVVLVSNYAAFDARYDIDANQIPVVGVYSGQMSNGGEMIRLEQIGETYPGYVASFEIDHVNYGTDDAWPATTDGRGRALIRVDSAAYGNDPVNWLASNSGGTPGCANIPIDTSGPTTPTNVRATVASGQVSLSWTASVDPESGVDHYVIYRDGELCGTSTTTSFTDSNNLTAQGRHLYEIAAVNCDDYEGARSLADSVITAGVVSVQSSGYTTLRVIFSEPVDSVSAQTVGNYHAAGVTISAAHLESDGFTVTLTTSLFLPRTLTTLTVSNVVTRAGVALPSESVSVTHGGTIDYYYWLNIGGGTAVSDLTSNSNYPNNPTGHLVLTSFDAPCDWADNYGSRIRGYIIPPTTGYYIFWIASDANGELWLSTNSNGNPSNTVLIASVPGRTDHNQWDCYAQQESAAIYLTAGSKYYIEVRQKEGSDGDNLSVAWQIPGTTFDTSNGLPIDGQYLAPYTGVPYALAPFTVGVNALTTTDATPVLSGTVSDATVAVTVRVGGTYYTAVNNGNGTWTLPEGAIVSSLSVGTYDVLATAFDSSGHVTFDTVVGELVINAAPVTANIAAVAPSLRLTPVDSIAVTFSEAVTGFNLEDLHFTRDGVSLSLSGATLTTSDQQHWTLGNLSAVTTATGDYQLLLTAAGSGITGSAGNALATDAAVAWETRPPLAGDFNSDGTVNMLDRDILLAHIGKRSGATFAMGDANYNGSVDLLDYNLWKANLGQVFPGSGAVGSAVALTASLLPVAPALRTGSVADVDVVFSEPIRLSTFTYQDLTLTRNGVPITLDATVTVSCVSETTYRVSGLDDFTADDGSYVLTLAAGGIQDWAGNSSVSSASDAWVVDATSPTSSVSSFIGGASYGASNWSNKISGTASDVGAGVSQVQVSVERVADGKYWSGSGFTQSSECYVTATGTTSWSLDFPSANFSTDGSYVVRVRTVDAAGNVGIGQTQAFQYDSTPPVVTHVYVASSAWQNAFLAGLGGIGCAIPGGADQLRPLPWSGLNKVIIEFSEDVSVSRTSLVLVGAAVPNYAFASFAYDAAAHRATWTLTQSLAAEKLQINLTAASSSGVADAAGNRLDGEWTNATWVTGSSPTGGDAWPSGNGVQGGDFVFRFNVLPGDADQNGKIDAADIPVLGQPTYSVFHDLDGNGVVNNVDLAFVTAHLRQQLPTSEPTRAAPVAATVAPSTTQKASVAAQQLTTDVWDAALLDVSKQLKPAATLVALKPLR